jgi:hypothetical protein
VSDDPNLVGDTSYSAPTGRTFESLLSVSAGATVYQVTGPRRSGKTRMAQRLVDGSRERREQVLVLDEHVGRLEAGDVGSCPIGRDYSALDGLFLGGVRFGHIVIVRESQAEADRLLVEVRMRVPVRGVVYVRTGQ